MSIRLHSSRRYQATGYASRGWFAGLILQTHLQHQSYGIILGDLVGDDAFDGEGVAWIDAFDERHLKFATLNPALAKELQHALGKVGHRIAPLRQSPRQASAARYLVVRVDVFSILAVEHVARV